MAQFEIGNKAAEKWTEENAHHILKEMRKVAQEDNDCLSLQDAIHAVGLYSTGLNYLIEKFPVFENTKKDIENLILARINKQALKNQFNAASSIWRMKQLGEKEKSEQDINLNGTGSIDLSTWLEKEDE